MSKNLYFKAAFVYFSILSAFFAYVVINYSPTDYFYWIMALKAFMVIMLIINGFAYERLKAQRD